jgi:hypothetical protein
MCFSIFVCAWQFAGLYGGAFFPADFFYTNAAYGRAEGQTMGGLFRINGPFGEPSALGYMFTGFLMFAVARLHTHFTPLTILMIAGGVVCILISTSTTAYVGLFFCFCFAVYDIATGRTPLLGRERGPTPTHLTAIAVVLVTAAVALTIVATNLPAIEIIVNKTILNKDQSISYQQRTAADAMALDIFARTLGLGLGLGSHKANNLLFTLLSNVGIVGLGVFCFFLLTLFRPLRGIWPREDVRGMERAILPFRRALLGLIFIHAVSAPNLSVLSLWEQIGGLIAIEASIAVAARRIRASPPAFEPAVVIKA